MSFSTLGGVFLGDLLRRLSDGLLMETVMAVMRRLGAHAKSVKRFSDDIMLAGICCLITA
ncbi:hypothetical protein [Mesorhizobium sp. SARCC-RB16n]|uniref:hypothetical protein n=1 Tax=Mesorhizobium sp. SARCC-RB16n TaxID=2116687 RepID=UPI00122EBC4F|nr:hypothetical protein [Mesorhizobium sp. SARCC-RB16n]